ncbi:hypothetical protein H8959_020562 [Pygathrix nigripes]
MTQPRGAPRKAPAGVPGAWEAAECEWRCPAGAAWQGGRPWLRLTRATSPESGGSALRQATLRKGSHSHVHFDEKLRDSVVMVARESDSSFLVKVGFLKILHRDEITFALPPVRRLGKDVPEGHLSPACTSSSSGWCPSLKGTCPQLAPQAPQGGARP